MAAGRSGAGRAGAARPRAAAGRRLCGVSPRSARRWSTGPAPWPPWSASLGPRQAVLMTSLWFGLAHYSGSVPDGFAGVLSSGLLALLLGGAMVATRGLGWPFVLHFAVDLVVFAWIAVLAG
ncbi:CPBP family glutamic-type intramembrane protease [Geodermatophilus africanus]|nr:CPBP family glutamic-type intramembrane protease [Geodermatophilus africanus]